MLKRLSILLLLLISSQVLANDSVAIATVSFMLGEADCHDKQGQKRSLSSGQAIYEGDRIVTHADGRLMLKMIDNAMLSLHPNSDLSINVYRYDQNNALNNHIDLKLNAGSVRSITGYAGQSNKDSYKLTTPLVAVGIRGTDFIVQTDASTSRATLVSGAIAVVSLQSDCRSAPAHCASAMLLDETHKNMMIEYQKGENQLQVVPIRVDIQQANSQQHNDNKAQVATISTKSEIATIDALAKQTTSVQTEKPTQTQSSSFTWIDNADASATKDDKVIKLVNEQGAYWLASSKMITSLPMAGSASLSLNQVQLFVDAKPVAVQATNPFLTLNFDARQFNTGMQLSSNALTQVANLDASGFIREDGRFYSTQGADVSGILANNANEAAYLFNLHHLNQLATGTAIWQK